MQSLLETENKSTCADSVNESSILHIYVDRPQRKYDLYIYIYKIKTGRSECALAVHCKKRADFK